MDRRPTPSRAVPTAASSLAVNKIVPRSRSAHRRVDAALGALIATLCEFAWLVVQLDTEEVHYNSLPPRNPTPRNLRSVPMRRRPVHPTAPTMATASSWTACRTSREPATRALAGSSDDPHEWVLIGHGRLQRWLARTGFENRTPTKRFGHPSTATPEVDRETRARPRKLAQVRRCSVGTGEAVQVDRGVTQAGHDLWRCPGAHGRGGPHRRSRLGPSG